MANKYNKWEPPLRIHKRNRNNWRESVNWFAWVGIGYGSVKLFQWLLDGIVEPNVIGGVAVGGGACFIALTIYGNWLQSRALKDRQAAMEQFITDQEADTEKQAKIDKEIIAQLKHEHKLSGTEQDKRLRALEQALKHLKGK